MSAPNDNADELVVCATDAARTFGVGAGAVVAVHGVCCEVRPGDLIALTGPSGSGKTTLLHLLAGLDTPTAGSISWPSIGPFDRLRPGPIAIVFQAPSLLLPLDVVENVELPLLLQGVERHVARRSALDALSRLDLDSVAGKLPEELSGGQAQRVAVARVLVGRPQLIMADEPTGQLDHESGTVVIDALIAAATQTGAALIVNTHDESVARRLDHRWSMAHGRLLVEEVSPC